MGTSINDIAKIAGVDKSTVSRSLNDSPVVAKKTKKKVKEIAEKLNFEFNANARALNMKQAETIGIIYPEDVDEYDRGLYHVLLLNDIRTTFEKEGLDTIVTFCKNRFTGESNIKKLINKNKIDGLLMVCSDIPQDDWDYIKKKNFPVVFLHYRPNINILNEATFISTDNFYGGRISAEHLVSLGHKKILCLIDLEKNVEYEERLEGYLSYFKSVGIPVDERFIIKGKSSAESGYNMILENINLLKEVTAVCVLCNEFMAMGALKALQELGYKVPQNISLMVYDDTPVGQYTVPELTTIHQPKEKISLMAVEQLIKTIKDKYENKTPNKIEPIKKLVKPTLVERNSCKKI